MSIIDHVGVSVKDAARTKEFYQKALAPLGITLILEYGPHLGFGRDGKPELWFAGAVTSYQRPDQLATITPVHLCLAAKNRAEVDAFYQAALAAGAKDNGPPGIRAMYHPSYYGAFVIDPDGHNLEACVHRPE